MADTAPAYALTDRYLRTNGRVHLTGIQALARLPIEQLRRDRAAGHNTAAFVSGYPGSPLGGLDLEIARARRLVPDHPIVHEPAVNEELGATAVMGSQLAPGRPDARYDGVVGFWYGKAPGLDRAGDAMRHGVFAGASPLGGAVVLVGDDPACKSSTMPSSSDATLVDLHMPILYPGTTAECIELGLHAVSISRASGLWASMKIVTPVADGSGTVDLPVLADDPVIPTIDIDGRPWRCEPSAQFLGPRMLEIERQFREIRLPLAHRYGVVNGLNRISIDPADAWIGLVATGFTYYEVLEALQRLGFDDERALADAGIRLLQLRMPVPFDADLVRRFARGLDEVIVIEEKNPTLEWLIKDALYGGADQPRVLGKTHEDGRTLMQSWGRLDADAIIDGLRERLSVRLLDRMAPERPRGQEKQLIPLAVNRAPYFCSGCPHNWGTKVPDEALVGAGTGCHGMTLLMDAERVGESIGITAMGNEGAQWIGMEPFVETDHLFQNYGDGTFFHSAQLALQNCIGAGKNITFKILYNHTVAMTGGQDSTAAIGVPELCTMLLAQGVSKVVITADDVGRYDGVELPTGIQVRDRSQIVPIQEQLRSIPGVTVLIHDQACAAEVRRARRRGRVPTPPTRVVINHRICEGCGDCGDVSGCLSVHPLDTPLGRKTTIDQASCNIDLTCLDGDCPSFMTVEVPDGAGPARRTAQGVGAFANLPPDPIPEADRSPVRLRLAGIGGTGVVTVAQILATGAMLDGWDVRGLDQTGLSQKAGPVISDVVLSRSTQSNSNLIGDGQADVLLGFDALVAAGAASVRAAGSTRTTVIASTASTPTGRMITAPDLAYPTDEIRSRLAGSSRSDRNLHVDATAAVTALVDAPAAANIFLLGVGVQSGAVPVSPDAIVEAIELNGTAVETNRSAFAWGRHWANDHGAVDAEIARRRTTTPTGSGPRVVVEPLAADLTAHIETITDDPDLRSTLAMLAADLVAYQDHRYATRFLDDVRASAAAERAVDPSSGRLTETVARSLHKLMAYKDEYEVARLLLAPEATEAAEAVGGPDTRIVWHLHPPLMKALGMNRKIRVGSWARPAIAALAAGKRIRGRSLDVFGRSEMRRTERALPDEFRASLDAVLTRLDRVGLDAAVEIAALPLMIRGYEDLKMRRIVEYRSQLADLLDGLDEAPVTTGAT